MPRIKARRRLDEYNDGKIQLHPDTLERVVLEATGDKELATDYRIALQQAQMDRRAAEREAESR